MFGQSWSNFGWKDLSSFERLIESPIIMINYHQKMHEIKPADHDSFLIVLKQMIEKKSFTERS